MKILRNRLSELEGALLLLILSVLCFLNGNIGAGIGFIVIDVVLVSLMILHDTIGKSKLTAKRNEYALESVKEKFDLTEGELVEVYCTPSDTDEFLTKILLNIQEKIEIRYFAFLDGEEVGIIPVIGNTKLEPQKMENPITLEYQFTPVREATKEEE